jgi:hypothetical protein
MSRALSFEDNVLLLISSVEQSASRRNSAFASDLLEAEELLAVLESSGARDVKTVLQPCGQVLVSWPRE